ncbi:MAG TPA: tetratricopeptide repeat protein [Longimicrobiales bacterium]|nr:tetratricopeptide repeat protein [Longimicrobiales bacterium]
MLRRILLSCLAAAVLTLSGPPAAAQVPYDDGRLELSTSSPEARAALLEAFDESNNIRAWRATELAERAVELDPDWAFAGFNAAYRGPASDTAARRAGLRSLFAADASAAELTWALAVREFTSGRPAAGRVLLQAASELAPDDPALAYSAAVNRPLSERRAVFTELTGRFPDYGPIRNIYGYTLFGQGEREAGIAQIEAYVRLEPDHPNPYDSYAELLQMTGRYDEAERHYRRALAVDPAYSQGHAGLAEVRQLRGDAEGARALLRETQASATTPAERDGLANQLGYTHLFEGDFAGAARHYERLAEEARGAGRNGTARFASWFGAMAAAAAGDTRRASTLMRAADAVPGEPDPSLALRRALAAPSDAATLRDAEAALEAMVAGGDAALRTPDDLAFVRALRDVQAGDTDAAAEHAAAIDQNSLRQLARAFIARGLAAAGRRAEAGAIRDEIVAEPLFGVYGSMARGMAGSIVIANR